MRTAEKNGDDKQLLLDAFSDERRKGGKRSSQ